MENALSTAVNSANIYDITLENSNNSELVPVSEHPKERFRRKNFIYEKIYYISDLHLIHKIKKAFPNGATDKEIEQYICSVVKDIVSSAEWDYQYLLIAGDVSSDYDITECFYKHLASLWNPKNIIAVLGNHELWGMGSRVNDIITCYQAMFDKLNINFLHNNILAIKDNNATVISVDDLKRIKETNMEFFNVSYLIIGGLGFSGFAKKYNAESGMYKEAVSTLKQDQKETKKFQSIYQKAVELFSDKKVIILTHTPLDNWSNSSYVSNWIYVSGHTHTNIFFKDDTKTVYADNQIGYNSTKYCLKFFYVKLPRFYDVFEKCQDGIYEIEEKKYAEFNRRKGIGGSRSEEGKYFMLKREGIYCFFFQKKGQDKYYLLSGGTINNIKNQDLNYYYDNLVLYSTRLREATSEIQNKLELISKAVKRIGGDGTIHGLIVDINFDNHVYLNYADGSITAYNAENVVEKRAYANVPLLLEAECPTLYRNYQKRLKGRTQETLLLEGEISDVQNDTNKYIDTDIYTPSYRMKRIQYLYSDNVIRIWDDSLLEEQPDLSLPE